VKSIARNYRYFVAVISIITILLCLSIEWIGFNYIPANNKQIAEVYIPHGSSIFATAEILHAQGVLDRPRAFVLISRLKNLAHSIKSGEYLIPTNITPSELLRLLVAGKVRYREITLVEGWRFSQILECLAKNPYLQHDTQGKTPEQIMSLLNKAGADPEGVFFPDTYKFARGTRDSIILKKAMVLMSKHLQKNWAERAANLPYQSVDQVLIVASLIEKETAVRQERPEVAGVILRRWQKKMLLQIDPTVIFALGDQYTGHLTRDNMKINSPYNTYLNKGLPPTPIAIPGLDSLKAALHPSEGDALYYVSKGDGTHQFSATLAAHNVAVEKLRLRKGQE
jgi:UPF0755 protein